MVIAAKQVEGRIAFLAQKDCKKVWTRDVDKALRFNHKSDAEKFAGESLTSIDAMQD